VADAYLITTIPDYEGFSVVEVHLDATAAQARVDAANSYADSAPAFTDDDASDEEVDAFIAAEKAWRDAHPFGPEVACGYLQERYRVVPIPLRTCGVPGLDQNQQEKP
jgi:hypothetical protein